MRTLDRITIYILAFTTCALALFLMLQKSSKQADNKHGRDLFKMASYEERKNRFAKEIEIEERLGKK